MLSLKSRRRRQRRPQATTSPGLTAFFAQEREALAAFEQHIQSILVTLEQVNNARARTKKKNLDCCQLWRGYTFNQNPETVKAVQASLITAGVINNAQEENIPKRKPIVLPKLSITYDDTHKQLTITIPMPLPCRIKTSREQQSSRDTAKYDKKEYFTLADVIIGLMRYAPNTAETLTKLDEAFNALMTVPQPSRNAMLTRIVTAIHTKVFEQDYQDRQLALYNDRGCAVPKAIENIRQPFDYHGKRCETQLLMRYVVQKWLKSHAVMFPQHDEFSFNNSDIDADVLARNVERFEKSPAFRGHPAQKSEVFCARVHVAMAFVQSRQYLNAISHLFMAANLERLDIQLVEPLEIGNDPDEILGCAVKLNENILILQHALTCAKKCQSSIPVSTAISAGLSSIAIDIVFLSKVLQKGHGLDFSLTLRWVRGIVFDFLNACNINDVNKELKEIYREIIKRTKSPLLSEEQFLIAEVFHTDSHIEENRQLSPAASNEPYEVTILRQAAQRTLKKILALRANYTSSQYKQLTGLVNYCKTLVSQLNKIPTRQRDSLVTMPQLVKLILFSMSWDVVTLKTTEGDDNGLICLNHYKKLFAMLIALPGLDINTLRSVKSVISADHVLFDCLVYETLRAIIVLTPESELLEELRNFANNLDQLEQHLKINSTAQASQDENLSCQSILRNCFDHILGEVKNIEENPERKAIWEKLNTALDGADSAPDNPAFSTLIEAWKQKRGSINPPIPAVSIETTPPVNVETTASASAATNPEQALEQGLLRKRAASSAAASQQPPHKRRRIQKKSERETQEKKSAREMLEKSQLIRNLDEVLQSRAQHNSSSVEYAQRLVIRAQQKLKNRDTLLHDYQEWLEKFSATAKLLAMYPVDSILPFIEHKVFPSRFLPSNQPAAQADNLDFLFKHSDVTIEAGKRKITEPSLFFIIVVCSMNPSVTKAQFDYVNRLLDDPTIRNHFVNNQQVLLEEGLLAAAEINNAYALKRLIDFYRAEPLIPPLTNRQSVNLLLACFSNLNLLAGTQAIHMCLENANILCCTKKDIEEIIAKLCEWQKEETDLPEQRIAAMKSLVEAFLTSLSSAERTEAITQALESYCEAQRDVTQSTNQTSGDRAKKISHSKLRGKRRLPPNSASSSSASAATLRSASRPNKRSRTRTPSPLSSTSVSGQSSVVTSPGLSTYSPSPMNTSSPNPFPPSQQLTHLSLHTSASPVTGPGLTNPLPAQSNTGLQPHPLTLFPFALAPQQPSTTRVRPSSSPLLQNDTVENHDQKMSLAILDLNAVFEYNIGSELAQDRLKGYNNQPLTIYRDDQVRLAFVHEALGHDKANLVIPSYCSNLSSARTNAGIIQLDKVAFIRTLGTKFSQSTPATLHAQLANQHANQYDNAAELATTMIMQGCAMRLAFFQQRCAYASIPMPVTVVTNFFTPSKVESCLVLYTKENANSNGVTNKSYYREGSRHIVPASDPIITMLQRRRTLKNALLTQYSQFPDDRRHPSQIRTSGWTAIAKLAEETMLSFVRRNNTDGSITHTKGILHDFFQFIFQYEQDILPLFQHRNMTARNKQHYKAIKAIIDKAGDKPEPGSSALYEYLFNNAQDLNKNRCTDDLRMGQLSSMNIHCETRYDVPTLIMMIVLLHYKANYYKYTALPNGLREAMLPWKLINLVYSFCKLIAKSSDQQDQYRQTYSIVQLIHLTHSSSVPYPSDNRLMAAERDIHGSPSRGSIRGHNEALVYTGPPISPVARTTSDPTIFFASTASTASAAAAAAVSAETPRHSTAVEFNNLVIHCAHIPIDPNGDVGLTLYQYMAAIDYAHKIAQKHRVSGDNSIKCLAQIAVLSVKNHQLSSIIESVKAIFDLFNAHPKQYTSVMNYEAETGWLTPVCENGTRGQTAEALSTIINKANTAKTQIEAQLFTLKRTRQPLVQEARFQTNPDSNLAERAVMRRPRP